MATIQIRDVPDEVHRTYRRRAAAAGMSLQQFLREELSRHAATRSPAEVAAAVRADLEANGPAGYAPTSSAAVVRAERDGR